jgi:hypothetical protein
LQIYTASGNNVSVIPITTKLVSFVQDIYRSLEPSHFKGQIVIYTSLDDSVLLNETNAVKFFDKNILLNNTANTLIFQFFQTDKLPLMWQNVEVAGLLDSANAVIYSYQNFAECFFANKIKIEVINRFDCASIFALQYHYLSEALQKYKQDKILHSSCTHFVKCWAEPNFIFFKNGPESQMQESLEQDLKSSLRGVDVVREYNLGASKPVDVRVYWKEANRAALIEMKWLGISKNPDTGKISTPYLDARANEGAVQLKNYLNLENKDTPTCITKGYLILIDGRRQGINKDTVTISEVDGMHFSNEEIIFDEDKKFHETTINFQPPIRMFTAPRHI